MAVLSMFYGIIVSMYFLGRQEQHRPRIHVKYSNQEAVLAIPDGELLEGKLKANKMMLVQA